MTSKPSPDKRCETCRWFAVWMQERGVGLCGQTPGKCVAKDDTCPLHEPHGKSSSDNVAA